MIVTDQWNDRGLRLDVPLKEIHEILSVEKGLMAAVPFDMVYTSSRGFVGRQIKNNDPYNIGLTWNLGRNLTSDVIVPIHYYRINKAEELRDYVSGYNQLDKFIDLLKIHGHERAAVVDLNYIFNILMAIAETQMRLTKKVGWSGGYRFKVKVLNVWRTVPFLDVETAMDQFSRYGIPVCLGANYTSPGGRNPESFIEISEYPDIEGDQAKIVVQATRMFEPIARIFGLPTLAEIEGGEDDSLNFLDNLRAAGIRAMTVQRNGATT